MVVNVANMAKSDWPEQPDDWQISCIETPPTKSPAAPPPNCIAR